MKRTAAKQTVSKPSASYKRRQKNTNAVGTHTDRTSGMREAHATNVPRGPEGHKRLKSGIWLPIDEETPEDDAIVSAGADSGDGSYEDSGDDDSDEITETTDVVEERPLVRNQRHETIVLLDIKDVSFTTEDEALPLCSNENSEDFSSDHNGAIIKVRDATRPPEQTRKGRQGKVTYAVSGKHFLHPTCGIRNAVSCKVNVSAIQVRTPESAQCGGVTISPGMLARIETSHRWLLIQAITARPSGDARCFHYDLIT
jgi:hypothetical protein